MSFDDLPRSPSGRIPQWVIDEAQGRAATPPPWRGDAYDTSADAETWRGDEEDWRRPGTCADPAELRGRHRRGRSRSSVAVLVLSLLLGAGFVGVWLSRLPEVSWDAVVAALSERPVSREDLERTGTAQEFEPGDDGSAGRPPRGLEEAAGRLGTPEPVAWDGSAYAFLDTQKGPDGTNVPVTWSPCRPVHYVVNTAGAPVGFVDDLATVMTELAAATGFVFVDDGTTTESSGPDRAMYQPDRYGDRWAPLLIQFADETIFPRLEGDVVGVGGSSTLDRGDGRRVAVTGGVWLDSELLDRQPVGTEPGHVSVLRHELAHVLGLDHVDDATQLMYPEGSGPTTFQSGDLYGLWLLAGGVCAPEL